nr:PAS domain S-box protein [Bacteroidota bacterium]
MKNNPDDRHNQEVDVLNQLFAAQTMLHIFPDENKMGEFITQALKAIPGIEGCVFFSRGSEFVPNTTSQDFKTILETIKNIPDEQDHFSISLPENENRLVISLQTVERSYGYVFITIENPGYIENYKAAINNFINMVTMELEKRRQKTLLIKFRFHLEEMVERRTTELRAEITERRKAEKDLNESEEKFRVLYHNSPDMFLSISPDDAGILQCNETLLKKTGYSREEIIGLPIFKMYHSDCMDEVKKAFQQFVETGVIQDKELILKSKDGSKIDVSLNATAVRNEAGKIVYSISSLRDITVYNRTKYKLKRTHERLTDTLGLTQ